MSLTTNVCVARIEKTVVGESILGTLVVFYDIDYPIMIGIKCYEKGTSDMGNI